MRKRRVLALLLALSLTVSGNSMTVLAAEQGGEPALATQEEETTETASGDEKLTEETAGETDEESSAGEDKSEETGEIGKTDPGESKDEGDTDESSEKGKAEDPGQEEPVQDDSVSENNITADSEETEETEEEQQAEVRIMTFTDDAGLRITYDANAARSYAEDAVIENGVLMSFSSDVKGVVDLREKTEITSIGNAFKNNTDVTYVMLPKTVASLADGAFQGCTALKGVSIPSRLTTVGANAFSGCSALTQIALPNSVTEIGANAFQGDSRLFMVNMVSANYAKLTTIGSSAFEGCSKLEFFCSDEEYKLPDSVTSIGDSAFKGCTKIEKVNMPDGVTSLGEAAYQGCSGIREVTIAAKLTVVSQSAFADCTNLTKLTFSIQVRDKVTIRTLAFANCSKLASVEFPQKVRGIEKDAFKGCTALQRIYINNDDIDLAVGAFPNENKDLCIIGSKGSMAEEYAYDNGRLRFIAINEVGKTEYYTYTKALKSPLADGVIKLTVAEKTGTSPQDINAITNADGIPPYNKGVKAGTKCYVIIDYGTWKDNVRLVSLKCNGEDVKYEQGAYFFIMPIGGAAITAEFELSSSNNTIQGNRDTIEGRLSSEATYDYNIATARMKVGQSAKFYLVNSHGGGETKIPTAQVTYRVANGTGVVSVDKNGTIKALKTGNAGVEAKVTTASGTVTKDVTIIVEETDIHHISLLVSNQNKYLTVDKDATGVKGVSISTLDVWEDRKFGITAAAFGTEDDDEEMAVSFTWSSSDTKVAKLKKTSTTAASSENEITIPKGADGEATITVSAVGADKKKVTKQFIVSVQNYEPRLTATKITINPNQEAGATTIGLIEAYGEKIVEGQTIEAYENKDNGEKISGIKFEFLEKIGSVSTYKVSAFPGMKQATYNVKLQVKLENDATRVYEPALTIVVKESTPNPTVTFDNKTKINLFYAHKKTKIQPIIGKLGDAEVSEYSLEPLTESDHKNYEDDSKFTENFEIDSETGTITQKAERLLTNKSGKPVLTGYLVLKFKGYRSNIVKKYKITIPTQTVAPSYVLDRTTDTFGNRFEDDREVLLQLLDKKTKQPIAWDEGYHLEIDESSTCIDQLVEADLEESEDGNVDIKVTIPQTPMLKTSRLVMKISNSEWAEGKEFKFTYNIKIDTKSSKQSLKKATITLNATYPDAEESFELVSNHLDETITGEQVFDEQSTVKTQEEYDRLDVTCTNGKGTIKLLDPDIKAGSYKYVYKYLDQDYKENKITLTVKVVKTMPTVTLKGTNAFNLAAKSDGKYVENSEMTMTVKNLPECQKYLESSGSESSDSELSQTINPKFYKLDAEATFNSIAFATKGCENWNAKEYFDFKWVEDTEGAGGTIRISLKQPMAVKTYSLKMTPVYENDENPITLTRPIAFNIRIYNSAISSVKLSAKGKINLLDRSGEMTEKNAILYTPTVANLKDTLETVKLYENPPRRGDFTDESKESTLFEARVTLDKKSFYIVPKDGVELENNKSYTLYVWLKMDNFKFGAATNEGIVCNPIKIKTAEVLPKVKTDKTAVDLYLSSKGYEATFVVQKTDEKAIGAIKGIAFGEKDEKARDSFDITRFETKEDGSLLVHMKLKPGVFYGCNTTNKITMYIQFENQGRYTAGTPITMNVKINK